MNCKYMNMLRVVRGNAFKLKIAVEAYTPSGRRIDSFALGEAVLKLDKNGTLTTKEYTILEGTTILVAFDGSESLGVYGFQMSGEYEGEAWRWANAEIFQIVESNVKAHIPEGCVLLDDTYNMALKIVLSGGDGITFTPSVSEQGIISWTNDGGLPNPEPRNIRGPRGEQGPQGEVGPQGPRGQMGLRGQIGPKGDKGDKGDTGATPVLDVTASVDENVGNPMVVVESFGPAEYRTFDFQFKNLKGQKGETGATGAQGPQGAKGDTGATGPQGPQGPQGIQGLQGEQGPQGEPGNYTKPASGIPLSDLNGNVASGIVYDVTANNSGATFASLSALLSSGSLSTLIPTSVRKGGMQIRFVCSSDNKYVQYLYRVTDAATAATFTNVANWEKVNLEAELLSLKIINNTYPNLIFETGKAVLDNGRIMELSGTNICRNVPVIPNSKIRLTLLTVSFGSGRGFAFFDQNGKFISAVSAVTGTKVYDIDVPSNAITLAITLWENTNSFTLEVNTSTTNVHNSIYRDLAPQIWGIQKITQNETINGLISELYFPRWIFDTKVVGYYPRRFFAIQPWNSTIHLSIYNTYDSLICIARTEVITVGKVLEAKIYQTNDTDLPIGMTLGYVICNDIPQSFNNRIEVVAGNYVCALKNSPQVAAYMASRSNDFSQSIQLCLPDNITAIVGDTLQVFYRGIVFSPMPDKYDVLVTCSKGFICPRYWEYNPTPSDVGTTTFKIQVKNDNRGIIAEKTCTLTTKAKVSSPASNKNVLCFGASTTQNGEWPHEANRRLTGSGGTPEADGLTNITFCGSKTKEGTGYFGAGGWNWHSYTTSSSISYRFQVSGVSNLSFGAKYTNNGNTFTVIEINVTSGSGNILCSVSSLTPTPLASGTLTKSSGNGDASITYSSVSEDTQNPLWDSANNKMSFIPYANSYCNGQIDFVYVWLGANGLASGQRDFTSILADVKTFADTLHTEFPNAKLKIMGEALPSHRGGMGANYGASGYWADEYGMLLAFFNLSDAYQGFANQSEYSSFVEFVNVATQFDIDFNMPHTEKAVNVRNTEVTEWIDTNGVHPALSGYMQVADVVYRNIIKELQ